MLAELNALVPEGRRENVDRQLVRRIIGLKHRMGLGIDWSNQLSNELHKPIRRRFDKRTVSAKQVNDIWTKKCSNSDITEHRARLTHSRIGQALLDHILRGNGSI